MTKFTKGPWVADVDCHGTVLVGCDEQPIADVTFVGHEGSLANGQLIAAAPELFEALQEMMAWAGEIAGDNSDTEAAKIEISAVEKARAALAKATGDTQGTSEPASRTAWKRDATARKK
mgnify:CR=1 FL=1